jgi:ElaB/YqjD/DUF883 family membrane-anchored ribosome-binding protein
MMTNAPIKTVSNDFNSLIREAQALFLEATTITGEQAETLRAKGLAMLDTALDTAQEAQAAVLDGGKLALEATDDFVQTNPWQAVAIGAGLGLVIGLLISRR